MYIKKNLKKYIDDLASREVVPGGGSAAALAACVGIALSSMVANFTIGNKRYARVQANIRKLLKKNEALRKSAELLMDKDVVIFLKLHDTFKMSKDSSQRSNLIQKNLKSAAELPLEICVLSEEAMKVCAEIAKIGNVNLITDAGCSVYMLESAYYSALLNVRINLKYIKDKKFISTAKKQLAELSKSVAGLKRKVIAEVEKVM
ncbi:MAG: cyclodeaminase/cyclohydrolase family protein [Candidatus Omnitrophota bacterium]